MGTYDTYSAEVACPNCGDIHAIEGQTKIFDPFGVSRWFRPGVPQPVDVTPEEIAALARDGWWRVRDRPGTDAELTLLADLDELYACDCGFAFAFVIHFEVTPGTVTMRELEVLDARAAIADRIDFAEAAPLCRGEHPSYRMTAAALQALPFAERAAVLQRWLDDRFDDSDHDARTDNWTTLVGPMQCEACGDVRERRDGTLLTHPHYPVSFFGAAWTGGVIFLGDRIPFDDAWLAHDIDRGLYFRARHPVGARLAILGQQRRYSCRCGAGRVRVVARFDRHAGALELVELSLRVLRSRADLHDIDFIEGHTRQSPHHAEPLPREHVLGWIIT